MAEIWSNVRPGLIWPWRLLLAAAFLICLIQTIWFLASPDQRAADINFETILGMETNSAEAEATHWFVLVDVEPGGAAEEAGIRIGDSVRFDHFAAQAINWQPGTNVGLTIARGDDRFRTAIVAREPKKSTDPSFESTWIGSAILMLIRLGFIALLVTLGYRNRTALQMAVMLMAGITLSYGSIPDLPLAPQTFAVLNVVRLATIAYLFPIFCLELSGGPYNRRQALLVHSMAAVFAAIQVVVTLVSANVIPAFDDGIFTRSGLTFMPVQLFSFAVIAVNYSRNDPASRNRIKIVMGAFLLLILGMMLRNFQPLGVPIELAAATTLVMQSTAFALLAYAVLKQRLFDFNFAINRTLVYGAAAFTLLVVFGLVEYIAKSMIPVAWPTAGPFISAGLAVLLFLMFHRLHHWFENHIERLFFSDWHRAEAALKRFVESAGHFDKMPVLCGAFTDALSRYAGGATAALYLRDGDGIYRLESGTLAGTRAAYEDDPAFALMRTERRPVFLTQAEGSLPGTLALPMLDQGMLLGFALLGTKPENANYRPDEVDNLGQAAHQVGLDFQALQARELRAANADLKAENRAVVQERDRAIADRDQVIGALANGRASQNRT